MDYHQLTKVVILLCITGNALAGLLPDGGAGRNNGYQYNRPGGSGFGGPGSGFGGAGGVGGSGSGFGGAGGVGGGDVRARPTTFYGPPGAGGDGAGFGGRPGGRYQDGGYQGGFGGGFGRDNGPPQPYNFQYQVYDPPSGNDYSQRESSDGNTVQGEYRVLLPDSRTQIVKYMADDVNGYTADVQYEGQAQFSRGGGGGGAGGYQGGNDGYQRGGSGYDRTGGGYQGGRFDGGFQGGRPGGFGADAASNQYLPPRNGYRK